MKKQNVYWNFRVSKQLKKACQLLSMRLNISDASLVRLALVEYLKQHGVETLPDGSRFSDPTGL